MQSVDDVTFNQTLSKAKGLVLVDFWAPWCGPCRQFTPVLEKLQETHADELTIYSLNVDEAPATAAEHRVTSIPTVLFFRDGELLDTAVGARSHGAMVELVEEALKHP